MTIEPAPSVPASNLPAVFADLKDRAQAYAGRSKAENTRRAYESDWRAFSDWCVRHRVFAMPARPMTVLAYLTAQAGTLKVSTLSRRLSAIRDMHKQAQEPLDLTDVRFEEVWNGIRRTHGQPPAKKAALMTATLRRALAALPDTLLGKRDRALLLVGFGGALRRDELVGLEAAARNGAVGWIEELPDGLVIHLSHSKTDQTGEGQTVGVPFGSNPDTCPVRAYRAWLEASGIAEGPAFRSIVRKPIGEGPMTGAAVAFIVKRVVRAGAMAEGMPRAEAEAFAARFAGHSLRAGLATSAALNDAPGWAIQRQLRHASFSTTAGYIREARLFRQNAAGMAGL